MRWASAVSLESDAAAAVAQVVASVARSLRGARPDLALLFVSPHHAAAYEAVAEAMAVELDGTLIVGCSGGGVIGGGHEIEHRPGLSLTAACLPGVALQPFAVRMEELPAQATPEDWRRALDIGTEEPAALLLLPEPFSFDADGAVAHLDAALPRTVKIGGLASGATQPGQNALFLGREARRAGAVGVALSGRVCVDPLVAQGCRPVGEPMFVTAAERNLVRQLDGRPALDALRDMVDALPPDDLALARHSLFVGLVMRRNRESYGRGDFLIRNLIGVDPDSGAVGVGGLVEEGAVLQFHLRDAATSAEDLQRMLEQYVAARSGGTAPPAAALLFSCLGRGVGLYGVPDHDSAMVRAILGRLADAGELPLAGFFCNGEIGPVQGQTYLHGYTSSLAIFRDDDPRVRR